MSRFITRLYEDAIAQNGVFFDGGVIYICRKRDNSDIEKKRFSCITRQMGYYGFMLFTKNYMKHHIGYTHPNFVKGRPDLLHLIYRRNKEGVFYARKPGRKKKVSPAMYLVLPDDAHDSNEHPFLEPLYSK